MFDIAWTELLVVAVIAIIVVGPKELPGMLRAFGKTFGQVRRTAREFQNTFNDALREAERQANLDEVKKDMAGVSKSIDAVKSIDPTKSVRKGLDDAKASVSSTVDAKQPVPDSVPLTPESVPPSSDGAPLNGGGGDGGSGGGDTHGARETTTGSAAEPQRPVPAAAPAEAPPVVTERQPEAAGGERR
ncbi:Sec-independent protein translocase protein TatB [Acuticoccus sp. M5D2P5]|uniref:Sec-independent protein translocase protein TatB n=1 Tax=Acuticoccus kalidii TaxID=2910977 RepID=UPI001F32471E|nr:Sec-independent protein translocase protein TatB [Acuticoccus kalidii]